MVGYSEVCFKCGFIESGARDMQSFLIALPEKACELVPRPTTYLHYGLHDFRRARFDAAAMRRDQETKVDLGIAERNAEIPTGNMPTLQNLGVTARLRHGTKGSTSHAACAAGRTSELGQ
jgi:hypothetical protein